MSAELKNKNYKTGKYACFAITDPKIREVWAADFRDRILHHLLVDYLEPIWEKKFIFHSYACRLFKGAHNAVKKLKLALKRQTATGKDLWHLKMDIESFFTSIDKTILFSLIKKHIANPDILWLAELIIFQNPTDNYIIKGDRKILASVPKHKSLFYVPPDKGLPIGNYTSQFFANVYLNELDQFIKHSLKCRYYFRYMDDLLFIHPSKEQLLLWRNEIKIFLETNLKLKLHPKKQTLQPVSRGIDFCGYIVKPDYTLVRRRTVKKLKNKLWRFNQKVLKALDPDTKRACPVRSYSSMNKTGAVLRQSTSNGACDIIFDDPFIVFVNPELSEDFRHIFSSINSVYGFFKHANCYNLRKTLYEKHFGILKLYLRPADKNYSYFSWKN